MPNKKSIEHIGILEYGKSMGQSKTWNLLTGFRKERLGESGESGVCSFNKDSQGMSLNYYKPPLPHSKQ